VWYPGLKGDRFFISMEKEKLYIQTFGCQMNVHDSDQVAALMQQAGYGLTDDPADADLIVINTCSIREKAAEKVYSQLGRFTGLKREKPSLIIAVGGCLAQQWGAKFFRRSQVLDIVFGTHNIHKLPEMVRTARVRRVQVTATAFCKAVPSLAMTFPPPAGRISTFVTIMHGCNNFCSYCIVPYVRGREESRPHGDILAEVRMLSRHGIREVTLLGQNVNSYGIGTNGSNYRFPDLLRDIGGVDGIERIRFTTSHPKDLSDDLIGCFGGIPTLCNHIHLPVQSGSDRVLAKMNRGYKVADYLKKVDKLRAVCPDISLTSDVIVGFPGETDADFQATIALMEKIRFDNLFSFKYSEREGTAAAGFGDKVPGRVKGARLTALQALQEEHTQERNRALEGQVLDILVEGPSKGGSDDLTGRTRSHKIVNFRNNAAAAGDVVPVLIKKAFLHSLRGECAEEASSGFKARGAEAR
jgi:tRNA-2-methylthio-N6-dimethylallyladenosine synthase